MPYQVFNRLTAIFMPKKQIKINALTLISEDPGKNRSLVQVVVQAEKQTRDS